MSKKVKRMELKRDARKTLSTVRKVVGNGRYRKDLQMVNCLTLYDLYAMHTSEDDAWALSCLLLVSMLLP